MTKQKILLTLVGILLIVNITTLTFLWLQYNRHGRPAPGMGTRDFIIREVGLSPAQQLQYDSLRNIHRNNIFELNEENRKLHDQMFQNIGASSIDSIRLDSMALKLSQNEVKMQRLTIFHFRELRNILDSKQQIKFDKILQKAIRLINRQVQPRPGGMPPPHEGGRRARPSDGPPPPPEDDGPPPNEDGPPPPDKNGPTPL